ETSGSVSVINIADNTVRNIHQIGRDLRGIAITPDGAFAYAVDGAYPAFIAVIDLANNTLLDKIDFMPYSQGIAITPDGAFAYVATGYWGLVSVIDMATHEVIANIDQGRPSYPVRVAIKS